MKILTDTTTTNDLASRYGDTYRHGVISEHEHLFAGQRALSASGRRILVNTDGSFDYVLCSEIVWIDTEDGSVDGRCGDFVHGDDFACPGHQAIIEDWRGQSEAELIEWEQRMEEVGR